MEVSPDQQTDAKECPLSIRRNQEIQNLMRICVVGHSLIHPRQYRFFDYWASHGAEILQIYPGAWGNLFREGGYRMTTANPYTRELDTNVAIFPAHAIQAVTEFKPDIIYIQQEYYSPITRQFFALGKKLDARLVVFIWENLPGRYGYFERKMIADTDFIICGNREAEELVHDYNENTEVMPQVGVDTDLFKPLDDEKEKYGGYNFRSYDLVFVGRAKEEKGRPLIQRGVLERSSYTLLDIVNLEYGKMPLAYNQAKVHVSPTLDTDHWKEQWLSFAHAEALSCGLRCIGSDTRAVVEYGSAIPHFYICKMGDQESLLDSVRTATADWKPNLDGRQYIIDTFGYEAMRLKLMEVFKGEENG